MKKIKFSKIFIFFLLNKQYFYNLNNSQNIYMN